MDDYESLPENASLVVTMMAGGIAGIAEHTIMYPVDSIKTRMQSLDCDKQNIHRSIIKNFLSIAKEEGYSRPFRGFGAMVLGSGPAHALYFSAYEQIKNGLESSFPKPVCQAVAGFSATLLHDGIMTPAEVIKQRMQMCCSPFKSIWQAVSFIYVTEGPSAFYRSYLTSLSMNIPFQVTHFLTYEYVTGLLNSEKTYSPIVHFTAGGLAGASAAFITMPLDVCKTLLNTQEPSVLRRLQSSRVVGLNNSLRIVYKSHGIKGFFRGLRPRVLSQMPATAISWSVYEFFKHSCLSSSSCIETKEKETESKKDSNYLWENLLTTEIDKGKV